MKNGALVALSCLGALLLAGPAWAEYDCQCALPDSDPYKCCCTHPNSSDGSCTTDGHTDSAVYSGGAFEKKISAGKTIQMYFQCTNNGPDLADVANVKITHKGSWVTCASDYLQDPVSIECTNWGTSSHDIHIDQINCAIWEPGAEPPEDTLRRNVDELTFRYEELRLEYEQLAEIVRRLRGSSRRVVVPGGRIGTRIAR